MLLLALAIAPGIAICLFIYTQGTYSKEPLRYLIVSFILGMLSTVPALIIQRLSGDVWEDLYRQSVLTYGWYAYAVIGFSEETSKFLMLRFYAYSRKGFNEPFDGILYAVMIGMGFATVENIEYVQRFGAGTGVVRFFLSVPAHASFAVLMGYNVGLAKLHPTKSFFFMWKGLLIAVFFHGTFDFFLFLQQNERIRKSFSSGLLSFGSFACFYVAIRLAMRTIRKHRDRQEQQWEDTDHFENKSL